MRTQITEDLKHYQALYDLALDDLHRAFQSQRDVNNYNTLVTYWFSRVRRWEDSLARAVAQALTESSDGSGDSVDR